MSAPAFPVLIDQPAAAALLSCCVKTVQRLAKSDPTFPKPMQLAGGRNGTRYSRAAVVAWAESRAAAESPAEGGA